ncbi:MAG: hypothetical protein GY936_06470 [Ignavibacteriae bacterium]|nr:hypothetical protein [Ignavibacteriota bacterium]
MSILLTPEVIILFIEDFLLLAFNTIAVVIAYRIQNDFNINSTSTKQYSLEKQTYLASYIIKFSLYLKIASILFFVFTLDKLSTIIPGAMCAVGVTASSEYGIYLLLFKISNIYLYGFWLLLNKNDMNNENYPYVKIKFKYFLFVYVFFLIEVTLQYLYFLDINPQELVSCCGTVFYESSTSIVGQLTQIPNEISLPAFYIIFLLLIYTTLKKHVLFNGILNLLFIVIGIITLISFFGTYVYELPTHKCPFCLLQSDYYYVGYAFYVFLILGTFFGIANAFLKIFVNLSLNHCKISLLFNTLYVLAVSIYPIRFYLINGVWL